MVLSSKYIQDMTASQPPLFRSPSHRFHLPLPDYCNSLLTASTLIPKNIIPHSRWSRESTWIGACHYFELFTWYYISNISSRSHPWHLVHVFPLSCTPPPVMTMPGLSHLCSPVEVSILQDLSLSAHNTLEWMLSKCLWNGWMQSWLHG